MRRRGSLFIIVLLFIAQLIARGSVAEERNMSATNLVLLPGTLTGIGSYGATGYWRLCTPRAVGLNEWQVSFVERLLKPNGVQKELLSRLIVASSAARSTIALPCNEKKITSGKNQLTAMELRVTALRNALQIIREPYEAFYSSLDNRQRALLDALGPSRRGWRW